MSGLNRVLSVLKQLAPTIAAKIAELGFKNKEMLAQLEYQTQKLEIDDVIVARATAKNNKTIYTLALCILVTFAFVMAGVLWGCYLLLTGGMPIKDVAVVAAVSGLVGSVVGYVAANAQTVVNFLYGASLGGRKNAEAITAAINRIGGALSSNSPRNSDTGLAEPSRVNRQTSTQRYAGGKQASAEKRMRPRG